MFPSDLNDNFRRDLAPRLHDYQSPETAIDDYSGDCVCLRVNALWSPFIIGVLDVLLQPSLWTGDPEPAIMAIQELMLALNGDSDTMNCNLDEFVKGITFDGGVLKIIKGDDTEVTIDGTERIVTSVGATGVGWEIEQAGEFTEVPDPTECATCDQYPDKPAYDNSGELRSCAIATRLTEYIMEKYQDCLDIAEAAADVISAADSILLLFPPAYVYWDAANDTVQEWFAATIAISRALDTVGLREDMKKFLYCELVDNSHVMSEDIWEAFKDEFVIIGDSLYLYLGQYKYSAIDSEAHKASYGEESGCETFDCTCLLQIDFESTSNYTVTAGTRSSGTGNGGGYSARNTGSSSDGFGAGFTVETIVQIDLGVGTTVGQMDFDYRATSSINPTANRTMQQRIRGSNDGSTWTTLVNITSGDTNPQAVWYSRSRTWSPASYRYLEIKCNAGWGSWGSGTMDSAIDIDNICIK